MSPINEIEVPNITIPNVVSNQQWLNETIEKEVYDQIKFVMPKESGGVYVPNK